jgi:hypothetical protein
MMNKNSRVYYRHHQKFLTVTDLGKQADLVIKVEISRAKNQQVILMTLFR